MLKKWNFLLNEVIDTDKSISAKKSSLILLALAIALVACILSLGALGQEFLPGTI
jgi:hypothetical protein